MVTKTGAVALSDALRVNGVEFVYHVPGESFLSVVDAINIYHPDIKTIGTRHEAGAALMAEAYGKLTGRPGIAMVTRNPGATNAINAVHTAYQDSSPMILFVGQVKRTILERETFMSYDYRTIFGPMTKWVAQIDDAARIPEFVNRAYQVATSGRMGPVVLVLPEDMLLEEKEIPEIQPFVRSKGSAPAAADLDEFYKLIQKAERPVMIVGGSGWTEEARENIHRFLDAVHMPVTTSFRRRDIINHDHPCYVGELGIGSNPALLDHMREADLVIMVNDQLSDVNTIGAGYMEGFTLFEIPFPKQTLIHVAPDLADLNRVFQADLAIQSDCGPFAEALVSNQAMQNTGKWEDWTKRLRDTYLKESAIGPCPGDLNLPLIMKNLRKRLPEDSIVTNGVGAYATWSQRYFPHHRLHTQLGPISGSMGYGLPAAISAKLLYPERIVVNFVGDGCYQMSGEELATAVQYGVNVITVLFNNNMYGTIRIHEENNHKGRVNDTMLTNPDFYELAKAYGAHAEKVSKTEEFEDAFERALASNKPAIIELCVDQEAIHSRYSLTQLRERNKNK